MDNPNMDNEENSCSPTCKEVEVEEPWICAECNRLCDPKQEIFENYHCGHRLCEMCRMIQNTKCKSCLEKDGELSLPTKKLDSLIADCSKTTKDHIKHLDLLKARKKRSPTSYKHIVPVEGSPGTYKCTVHEREINQKSISYHYSCGDVEKPLKCDQCGKTFVKRSQLEGHVLNHLGIKPYKCTQCPKAFMQPDKLKRHEITHSDKTFFTCQTCSKEFKFKDDFKKHMLTHTATRTFNCDKCLRSYKTKINLAEHKLSHSGTKNFVCEVCGKSYIRPSQLKEHRRRHSSKPHFKCATCGHRFFHRRALKRHQLTHSEIMDYECSICNTTFKRRDNLERHMRNLHPHPVPSTSQFKMPAKLSKKNKEQDDEDSDAADTPDNEPSRSEKSSDQQSVIVSPKKFKSRQEKAKSYPVSVIVSPQKATTSAEKKNTESPSEIPKLLSYRILPPDKRFLLMNESKSHVPNIMNLKARHIVQTSESNIETIVTTDDQVGKPQPKIFAIDEQAEFCKKVSQGKEDKMNKCHKGSNKMKDNLARKKSLKFHKSTGSLDSRDNTGDSSLQVNLSQSESDLFRLRESNEEIGTFARPMDLNVMDSAGSNLEQSVEQLVNLREMSERIEQVGVMDLTKDTLNEMSREMDPLT